MGIVFIIVGLVLGGIGLYRRQNAAKGGQQADKSSIVQIVLGAVVLIYGIIALVAA